MNRIALAALVLVSSSVLAQTVSLTASTTTVVPEQPVRFTVVINGAPPGVTTADVVVLGTQGLVGTASVTGPNQLSFVGTSAIDLFFANPRYAYARVLFPQAANPNTTYASPRVNFVVNQGLVPTAMSLVAPASAMVGEPWTLEARVEGSVSRTPSGPIDFFDGTRSLGNANIRLLSSSPSRVYGATLAGVHFPVGTAAGAKTIRASFAGDANNTAASSTAAVTALAPAAPVPVVGIFAVPATAYPGQAVTLALQLTGHPLHPPTGQVLFTENGVEIGRENLPANGRVKISRTYGATTIAVTKVIAVSYLGDHYNDAYAGTQVLQVVGSASASVYPVARLEYDANGNARKFIVSPAAAPLTTEFGYDALDRLTSQKNPKLEVAQVGFDGPDEPVWIADGKTNPTDYQPNTTVSPDTGTTMFVLDGQGLLKKSTDARGAVTQYRRDAKGRVDRKESVLGAQTVFARYGYDETGAGFSNGIGRMTSSATDSVSTRHAYNELGQMTLFTQSVLPSSGGNPGVVNSTVGYAYTDGGQLASVTYPSGRVVTYTYAGGLLQSLSVANGAAATPRTIVSNVLFSGSSARWTFETELGPRLNAWTHDLMGRPVRYSLGEVEREVRYSAAGKVASYNHTGSQSALYDQAFTYDNAGRLETVTRGSAVTRYAYDPNGNRTLVTNAGGQQVYTTDPDSNRLGSTTNPSRTFTYDDAGNITGDSRWAATYDASGRMVDITAGGFTTAYAHDAWGRRIRKAGPLGVRLFVYNPQHQLLGEYDAAGAPVFEYIWMNGHPVAAMATGAAGVTNIHFIYADHLGSPRVVMDERARIRWRWASDPFGNDAPNTNPVGVGPFVLNLRMPGQYYDAESGLFYNHMRDYDPAMGRYIESDPLGLEGGLNTYAYVESDPLLNADPSGLFLVPWLLAPTLGPVGGLVLVAGLGWVAGQMAWNLVFNRPKNPPDIGPPGGFIQGPNRGREYCPSGKPLRDYDKPHQGFEDDHIHEWEGGEREHPGRPYSPWTPDTPPGGPERGGENAP